MHKNTKDTYLAFLSTKTIQPIKMNNKWMWSDTGEYVDTDRPIRKSQNLWWYEYLT